MKNVQSEAAAIALMPAAQRIVRMQELIAVAGTIGSYGPLPDAEWSRDVLTTLIEQWPKAAEDKIEDLQDEGLTPVLVEDNDPRTHAMARALGCTDPRAGVVFAASGAVASFVAEMVETACCLGNGKTGYVALYEGHADVR
jgi:hypothetical protein